MSLVCQLPSFGDIVPSAGLAFALMVNSAQIKAEALVQRVSASCVLALDRVLDERPACWRLRCGIKAWRTLGCDLSAMHLINQVMVSPDQANLAVLSIGEGHPIVEIVALKPLLERGDYQAVCSLNPYPGTLSLSSWDLNGLIVDSDVDLKQADSARRAEHLGVYRFLVRTQDCQLQDVPALPVDPSTRK